MPAKQAVVKISPYEHGSITAELEFQPQFPKNDIDKLFDLLKKYSAIKLHLYSQEFVVVVKSVSSQESKAKSNLLNFLDELSKALGYEQAILPT